MRTPGSENELVRGLLFSENVYSDLETDPLIVVKEKSEKGFITSIDVTIPKEKIGKGFEISRSIISVSSCGICGKSELDSLPNNSVELKVDEKLNPEIISIMFEQMNSAQNTFKQSGGSHAAAAFTINGKLLAIQEDIGRHNAVDKVIGSLLFQKQLPKAKCLVVSGRISYEIVNKCFLAGIPFLAAVSAPSSMAVDLAEQWGITLMAFCRENKFTAYSHVENIKIYKKILPQRHKDSK
ncbi:MAG: formate dehydrogenase family accessory protein FdhD [Bacteroidetes bacterium RIFCSPLOWO2_12_FULL_31_6]|nr:MAG: formate dehydrogenase family accessory protein FdhD [Bacteroidetes bacterium RIFCSPLOWO2_12_FULL_31_6]